MGIELIGKTSIDFIGRRKYAFIFSAVLVGLGIFAVVQLCCGGVHSVTSGGSFVPVHPTGSRRITSRPAIEVRIGNIINLCVGIPWKMFFRLNSPTHPARLVWTK